ncbi:MAG: NAD(P)H-hydrate dehydratase, partial [Lachnospiraceae bacterium]|nr:NAD(P)H-hydrate dehydratase [Lachnospiraceae bacterium]
PPVGEVFHLIEESDVKAALGVRANFSNKGTYGYCALIGGSTRYSGAIRLAALAEAAMRSGAGVVKIALPQSLVHDVTPHILESTLFPLADTRRKSTGDNDDLEAVTTNDREVTYVPAQIDELISNVRCVTFGMGIGTGEGAADILMHLLSKYEGNLVIDADGLTLLSKLDRDILKGRKGCTVLTPHIKEFSRLSGKEISEINEDPIKNARQYAFDTNTILLLKGPSTIVTNGDIVYIVDRGCPGMATAGSGDVLSGIMSAVTSFVSDKCLAAAVAAYINGAAGELAAEKYGDISMTAGDTVSFIPKVTM